MGFISEKVKKLSQDINYLDFFLKIYYIKFIERKNGDFMAKLSKNELMKKYVGSIGDENLAIEFMEDISDSIEESSAELDSVKAELEQALKDIEDRQMELESFKQKYKERFLSSDIEEAIAEDAVNEEEVFEEKKEEDEVIDVQEI